MDAGAWVLAASWAVGLVTAFFLRTRAPGAAVVLLLAAAGAGLAWGGLLLRPDPSVGESVLSVAALTVLVPAHVRIVLGPLGRRSP